MGLRSVVSKRLGLLAAGAALVLGMMAATAPAEARGRHRHYKHRVHATWHVKRYVHVRARHVRPRHVASMQLPAEFIMDANSGRVLHAHNENAERHPASLTKVMTLYLLFEQIEAGRFKLDSEIPISAHAAAQAPSKLGLRPGSEIEVEDAIKAIVTKSANDIAVAIGEAVGGSEDRFAEMMTRKAHALGMSRTNYANASGLPNSEQITTARDQAVLAKAIQDRFPRFYHYFSTRSFNFAGRTIPNHNHLIGRVDGVDGIKTGYTARAGFNLMTSIRRDGHHIVGVVLGGPSARIRDNRMAALLENTIEDSAVGRTAVASAEDNDETAAAPREEARPVQKAEPIPVRETVRLASAEPMRLMPPAQLESVRANVETARADAPASRPVRAEGAGLFLGVPPAPIPTRVNVAEASVERPRPAYVSGAVRATDASVERPTEKIKLRAAAATPATTQGTTARGVLALATTTPSSLRWVTGAPPARAGEARETRQTAKETAKAGHTQVARAQPRKEEDDDESPAVARSGWIIQIGATDDLGKAKELLSRAKGHSRVVARAQPFTEKVQKGSGTLYRARFAGLQETAAESACKELKRSGMACFAMKN